MGTEQSRAPPLSGVAQFDLARFRARVDRRMSYSPRTLQDLGAYWTGQGGVNLGVVGDVGHTVGYHLGRDRI